MDAKELLLHQLGLVRFNTEGATKDLTQEQLNWTPPGSANPISCLLIHTFGAEDGMVQGTIQGKPTIWRQEGWAEKTGAPTIPNQDKGWEEMKSCQFEVETILDYCQTVRAATEAYIDSATPEELERVVNAFGQDLPVADVLALVVIHGAVHTGEIAAIVGIQGGKGLPV